METMQVDCDVKTDKDDSGCIQDETSGYREISLLDLSDDVLLYILRHCSPRDLKALGYTCPRLGSLVQDRSLWKHVDARNEVSSMSRLQWYLTHMLHKDTHELLITGDAQSCTGCMGLVNTTRGVAEEDIKGQQPIHDPKNNDEVGTSGNTIAEDNISVVREMPFDVRRQHARYFINQRVVCLPRLRGSPSWSDDSGMGRSGPQECIGPHFTLTPPIMRELRHRCTLTSLSLEFCNVNCNVINLGQFPRTLKKLSLRGTRFYNLIIDRSFLTKINSFLPVLEYIDLSECEWMEPSSLLPLSKHPVLTHLVARDCYKLTEFVAYASLTARYGFRTLKVLDLRGSPVGDSEVAALGWLPTLEELWLSATSKPKAPRHAHYTDDVNVTHMQLDDWEVQEPEYYQGKSFPEPIESDEEPASAHVHFDPNDAQPSTSRGGPSGSYDNDKDDKENLKKRGRGEAEEKTDEKDGKDDDDDDDDGNNDSKIHIPSKKPKRERLGVEKSATKKVRGCQVHPNANQDNGNLAEMPLVPPSNVIVVAGPSNASPNEENVRQQNHPIYCICPEHRSVEKTDKATETDNMEIFRVCDCHKSEPTKKSDEANNSDSQDKRDNDGSADDKSGAGSQANRANSPRDDDYSMNNEHFRGTFVRFRRNKNPVFVNYPNNPEILISRLMRNREGSVGNPDALLPMPEPDNANAQDNPQRPHRFPDILRAFAAHLESQGIGGPSERRNAGPRNQNQNDNQDQNGSENQNGSQDQSGSQDQNEGQNQNGFQNPSGSQDQNDNQNENENDNQNPSGSQNQDDNRKQKDNKNKKKQNDGRNRAGPSCGQARPAFHPISARNPHLNDLMQRVDNLSRILPGSLRNSRPRDQPEDQNPPRAPRNPSVADRNPNLNLLVQNASPEIPENQPNLDNLPFQLPLAEPLPHAYHQAFREPLRRDVQYIVEPRHHVLYVSVGSQFNTFRFPRDNLETDRSLYESHVDPSVLVTDFSIRRFGRADGEDVNFIHFGPHGPILMGNSVNNNRPDRSNLRVLSVTGYRNITDRSLSHLITAAPHLRRLDFSGTNVTRSGVENFRSLRPDCDVVHSVFKDKKKE